MKFEVLEPFKTLRVRYSEKILLLENPKDMLNHWQGRFKKILESVANGQTHRSLHGTSPVCSGVRLC